MTLKAAARTRPGRVTIAEVFDRGRQGDAAALEAIDRAGRALGLGLAHLVNLFAPELIVLGGDLIAAEDLFVPRIREALEGHALRPLLEDLEIKTSELGPDIALKGAASLAFRQSIQTPELLKQISGPVAPTLEPAMGR